MAFHKPNFDAEAHLYEFECAIDTLDKIADGLPEDRTTANALTGLHQKLCKLYAISKAALLD